MRKRTETKNDLMQLVIQNVTKIDQNQQPDNIRAVHVTIHNGKKFLKRQHDENNETTRNLPTFS